MSLGRLERDNFTGNDNCVCLEIHYFSCESTNFEDVLENDAYL